MTDEKLKSDYYMPYCDAWKVLKTLQHVDETPNTDEHWHTFTQEINSLGKKYPRSKYVEELIAFLINTADIIAKENQANE